MADFTPRPENGVVNYLREYCHHYVRYTTTVKLTSIYISTVLDTFTIAVFLTFQRRVMYRFLQLGITTRRVWLIRITYDILKLLTARGNS